MVLQDRAFDALDELTLDAVLAPKVAGTVAMAGLLRDQPLDFLAFFSSANAFFGNPGQANYAAASTFQDAFAAYLGQAHHLPVRILNWGMWGEVGAVASDYYREKAAQLGVQAITCAEGVHALESILGGTELQVMPMKVQTATLRGMGITVARVPPLRPTSPPSTPCARPSLRSSNMAETCSSAGSGKKGP